MRTVGSLFSGIGGLDLGLERAGMDVRWQVENDEFATAVLRARWPGVTRYGDITGVSFADVEPVDVIAGGFPCQDISHAGRGAGIEGKRSGLWAHFAEAVRVLRPRFVLVENVPALLARGMGRVVGDLAAIGYDAEWDCVPAAAVGAPHLRARVWILAYPCGFRDEADDTVFAGRSEPQFCSWWVAEPDVARVVHGAASAMDRDRIGRLGNAVVPQVAEWIGRRILEMAD